jgi:hypothetical protein
MGRASDLRWYESVLRKGIVRKQHLDGVALAAGIAWHRRASWGCPRPHDK